MSAVVPKPLPPEQPTGAEEPRRWRWTQADYYRMAEVGLLPPDARVELIDGPQAGAVFVQTVCGYWDYGEDLGYSFSGLPLGIPVTLRATATGYKPAQIQVTPTNPYSYTNWIVLTKESSGTN